MKRHLICSLIAAMVVATACAPRSGDDSGNAATAIMYEAINHEYLLEVASLKRESDYTIPSFTRLRMAVIAVENDSSKIVELADALNSLVPSGMPFSITTNINGDPRTGFGFNWFTDSGYMSGEVQIVKGIAGNGRKFRKPFRTVRAASVHVDTLPYSVRGNNLDILAGIPSGTKKSYSSQKATVSDLKPGRVYSYRVGNDENWSLFTGRFGQTGRPTFSHISVTDEKITVTKYEVTDEGTEMLFDRFEVVKK